MIILASFAWLLRHSLLFAIGGRKEFASRLLTFDAVFALARHGWEWCQDFSPGTKSNSTVPQYYAWEYRPIDQLGKSEHGTGSRTIYTVVEH